MKLGFNRGENFLTLKEDTYIQLVYQNQKTIKLLREPTVWKPIRLEKLLVNHLAFDTQSFVGTSSLN